MAVEIWGQLKVGTLNNKYRIKGTYLSYLNNLDETPQISGIRGVGGVSALLTSRLIIAA